MRAAQFLASLTLAGLAITACSGSETATPIATSAAEQAVDASGSSESGGSESVATDSGGNVSGSSETGAGLRLVSADVAKATIDNPSDDLVILDVRTPEEFAEGHIDGAIMLDFYRDDFAAELAKLDPDVPYVLYCRSGNRSGQALQLMAGLEFQNVQDVDGGVLGWQQAGLPLVTD